MGGTEFLQNACIEKRTLDFHVSQLFKARQGKHAKVAYWIHKILTLGLQFCEAALLLQCRGEKGHIRFVRPFT